MFYTLKSLAYCPKNNLIFTFDWSLSIIVLIALFVHIFFSSLITHYCTIFDSVWNKWLYTCTVYTQVCSELENEKWQKWLLHPGKSSKIRKINPFIVKQNQLGSHSGSIGQSFSSRLPEQAVREASSIRREEIRLMHHASLVGPKTRIWWKPRSITQGSSKNLYFRNCS